MWIRNLCSICFQKLNTITYPKQCSLFGMECPELGRNLPPSVSFHRTFPTTCCRVARWYRTAPPDTKNEKFFHSTIEGHTIVFNSIRSAGGNLAPHPSKCSNKTTREVFCVFTAGTSWSHECEWGNLTSYLLKLMDPENTPGVSAVRSHLLTKACRKPCSEKKVVSVKNTKSGPGSCVLVIQIERLCQNGIRCNPQTLLKGQSGPFAHSVWNTKQYI